MNPKTVLVALALIAGVCLPSHAQREKKGQEDKAVVQAAKTLPAASAPSKVEPADTVPAKTVPAKGGRKASGLPPMEHTVNSTADLNDASPGDGFCETAPGNGVCTFRAAVTEGNAVGADTTIKFDTAVFATPQTIELMSQVMIYNFININGPGADKLTLSGRGANRVLWVLDGITAEIRDVTLANGSVPGGSGGCLAVEYSNAVLDRIHVKNCTATVGGGIYIDGGNLTMSRSAVTGNTTVSTGGGIYSWGVVSILGSTISGNTTQGHYGGGIYSANEIFIYDSTITNNTATTAYGGGVFNNGYCEMRNTILAGNHAPAQPYSSDVYDGGGIYSLGYNLFGIADPKMYLTPEDKRGSTSTPLDAKLGPLANNGGPTPTHWLLSGSPAIDGGSSSEPFDQRGMARVVDHPEFINAANGADIGAFEVQTTSAAPVRVSGRVTDARGRSVIGATVSFVAAGGDVRVARANSFGYYTATDLRPGEAYAVTVKDRSGRTFATLMLTPTGDMDGFDFTAR